MSRHEDDVSLRQMLDHIEEAVALTRDRSRAELESDRMFFLAILKLVEIVGEAATRVSDRIRAAHPEIPWHEIISARNRLIHGYDAVDYDILWEIVTADFPQLATQIRNLRPV
ncbi:MAG TPA: HepT-like ribonuclease domain-containing protein, partial [Acidobacteriota bacterium]|nr:HepT-like ribonuclease domain-containing protein [Acidobacteriota bacterium]